MEDTITITGQSKKQIYKERSKVRKHCKEMIMNSCSNSWGIPTDEMKKEILISHGWDRVELDVHHLQFIEPEMTEKEIENIKRGELNTLLACSFFFSAAQLEGYDEEYEDIIWDVVDWFKYL